MVGVWRCESGGGGGGGSNGLYDVPSQDDRSSELNLKSKPPSLVPASVVPMMKILVWPGILFR